MYDIFVAIEVTVSIYFIHKGSGFVHQLIVFIEDHIESYITFVVIT